jgi:hypothetical protein
MCRVPFFRTFESAASTGGLISIGLAVADRLSRSLLKSLE